MSGFKRAIEAGCGKRRRRDRGVKRLLTIKVGVDEKVLSPVMIVPMHRNCSSMSKKFRKESQETPVDNKRLFGYKNFGRFLSLFKLSTLGKGSKKKTEKVWSFTKPGGGGVSEGGEKTKLLF